MAIFGFEISMPILFTRYHIVTSNHKLVFMTAWMIAKRPFPKILCPPAVNIIHGLNENNILIFLPTQSLVLSIYMSHYSALFLGCFFFKGGGIEWSEGFREVML